MLIPLQALQRYFSSPISLKEILRACDAIGIEVTISENREKSFSDVVAVKILDVQPHPNAEKLRVAMIYDGENTIQVVCGAPNCREGIVTAFARVGAVLVSPEGEPYKIKKSKIRGVESFGMCCSTAELGITDDSSDGILELPNSTLLGEDLSTILGDVCLELSLTPNLGHCASLLGVAREMAFASGKKLAIPQEWNFSPFPTLLCPSFERVDEEACPLFAYAEITGVTNMPSPKGLQETLIKLGQKPINAIVDITNYVMLGLGQPLHAYDQRFVDADSLSVSRLDTTHNVTTLQNEEISLPESTLVVRDNEKILAVAGVIGCKSSSVQESTDSIVLEAAYFSPKAVGATIASTGLQTEASYRFSRGIDPKNVLPSLYAAIHLILDIFPQAKVRHVYVLENAPYEARFVHLRASQANRLLGINLDQKECSSKLESLGFQVVKKEEDKLVIEVPSYRHDISNEADLVEELFRSIGFEAIAPSQKTITSSRVRGAYPPSYSLARQLVQSLTGFGLLEFYTEDLLDPSFTHLCPEAISNVHLSGSKSTLLLRPSLFPGLLSCAARAFNRRHPFFRGFEIGKIYNKIDERYQEREVLGLVLGGEASPNSWIPSSKELSFFSMKGLVEKLLADLGINGLLDVEPSDSPLFHPFQQGVLKLRKNELGILGTVHPKHLRNLSISQPVFFAEIVLDKLLKLSPKEPALYKPVLPFPSSFRDITLTVPDRILASTLVKKLLSLNSKWLESVTVVSIYRDSKDIDSNVRNISLRLTFRGNTKTLSNQEVDEEYNLLVTSLYQQLERE
ncbi:phenylalanine--tRNA ligase subunit beta [Chlamydiifrater volucris]|uniref:phenylalanine--tRNA ligase subunit beta n=1 Tax=Chlamydiifrater volucris TaxID=2681470 RepID=UPI001BD06AF3|nr:phenylalanine--tRNA ligase subunit beta [Chlamydiifrater volucris]